VQYWLVKTEPTTYSWEKLVKQGKTRWDGVRNYQARNNLRAMKPGDLCLVYHSVEERRVMGAARIVGKAYPDPTAKTGDWSCVDLEPAFEFPEPVVLARMRTEPALKKMTLLRQPRLSVAALTEGEYVALVVLGGAAKAARAARR